MNPRALALFFVAVALAGGLAFLFLGPGAGPAQGPEALNAGPEVSLRPTRPADGPAERAAPARVELEGVSGSWTVFVGGPKGEPLPEARVRAQRGDDVRSATGRATWVGLQPGTWTLTVEAADLPTWRQDVVVAGGGQPTRTVVKLTNETRVVGVVLDQRGDPAGGVQVWLLGPGASHPTEAARSKGLANATSSADGRFQIQAADAGTYRLSVGRAGQPARYEGGPIDLQRGRDVRVRVVVPARARLTVEAALDDYKGPNVLALIAEREAPAADAAETKFDEADGVAETDGRGRRLSPGEAEALRRKREELGGSEGAEGDELAEAKAASLEALTAEQEARIREAEARMERERQRRARLVPEGWANVRSVRFDAGTVGKVQELPEGRPVRFILYRGVEGFQINENLVAPEGADVLLTLTPPAPFAPGVELPEFPRTAASRMVVTNIGQGALPLGLTIEE